MSRALTPLLAVSAAVALAAGLVHCSSGDSQKQAPLRFTYDDGARVVRVHTTVEVDPSTKIYARVRRGNLTATSEQELDCDEVAKAKDALVDTSVPPKPGADGAQIFRGPEVGSDIPLTEFFDDNVIVNDPSPDQAAEMKKGVNSIVEGCVVRGTEVVAKVQMSLLRAWDDATPDLVQRAAQADDGKAATSPPIHAVSTYGALCEEELGEIPFFPKRADGTYETYDCTSEGSVIIPITVSDNSGRARDATTPPDRCDRPDWLRTSCAPFARVRRMTNSQGSDWVLLCRGMGAGHTAKTKVYNDIALIGHNPKTGKTCFVQNALYFKNDAAHIPSPADPKRAETLWASFKGDACNSCHDSDPWIHSPWLDQAKDEKGQKVVPYMGEHPEYPLGNTGPYRLVGGTANGWAQRRHLTSAEAGPCTGCHRIAEGATMYGESLDNVSASWTARSLGQDPEYARFVTPSFQAFPRSHTMPPTLGNLTEASWPASDMGKAASFVLGCSEAGTCRFSSMPLR